MKRRVFSSVFALGLFATLGVMSSVHAQGIRWASSVDPIGSGRENILHAPDNLITGAAPTLTMNGFGPTMRYSQRRLAEMLGVTEALLSRADVIAFEGNGGHGAGVDDGWESSIWTFGDGIGTRTVVFNELVGASPHPGSDPAVIATGSITNVPYSRFFGLCSPDPTNFIVSYILIDLHSTGTVIDTTSPRFTIRLENGRRDDGSFGEGTPDPDAVGIFSNCRRSSRRR
jgi:hypothetical protein